MKLQNNEYHIARLLILIHAFGAQARGIDGLTKLAKLDFLLRYPAFLGRLLRQLDIDWPDEAEPTANEELAVESRMIRYKYGPWDDRYYSLLGQLVGMGLVTSVPGKGRIAMRLTERGTQIAVDLESQPEWRPVYARSRLLFEYFNTSGNRLKTLIYDLLPDAVDRPLRTEI